MKINIIKIVRILAFLALAVFFLILAFGDVQLKDLISGFRTARYEWVLISLFFATMALFSRTYRWILLIEPLGYKPAAKNTFFALMSGYLANFILPRIGEITRCGSLNRTDRIPVDKLLGTVITERISDLLIVLLLATTVFFLKIGFFGDFLYFNLFHPLYLRTASLINLPWLIWMAIGLSILLALLFYRMIRLWLRKYHLFRRLEKILRSIIDGMKTIGQMNKTWPFLLHTVFIWLMYFLMTWAVIFALPSTAGLGAADVLFIMVIGGLAMAAPVQGGIGAYHWVVSMGLGIYGIPREDGLVFATLSHESQALLMIILGSFSMFMIFTISKKARHSGNETDSLTAGSDDEGEN